MANQWENSRVKLLLKIKSHLPKSLLFYYVFLVFKLLPLIIITHDWNINYGKGISAIVSQFTLCPILTKVKNQNVTVYIISLIFVLSLCCFIFCLICKHRLSKQNHLIKGWKIGIKLTTYFLFFINFLFSQQIYALIIENLFSESTFSSQLHQIAVIVFGNNMNVYIFYISITLQLLLIIFCLLISYLISLIFFEPLYFSNILLTNYIGEIDWSWSAFSFIQFANQLEYHLPFKYILYVKGISRGLYILYYMKWFIDQGNRYYCDHIIDKVLNIVLSMCFISSVIEFGFMSDFDNNLTLLTSNINYILFKLFLEFILSCIIVAYLQYQEITFMTYLHLHKRKQEHCIYASFNRLFYYISDPTKNKTMTIKITNAFYLEMQEHKLNCKVNKEKECYCINYLPEAFYEQSYNFFFLYNNQKTKVSSAKKNLKDQFISFYSYIEKLITDGINKKHSGVELNQYLLINVLFYLEFDKNITKAFYFLEEYMKSSQYRTSTICQVQVRIFRQYIKDKFYLMMEKSTDIAFQKHFVDFKNIIHYNQIEKSIRKSFEAYYIFLIQCSIQGIKQSEYFAHMNRLSKEIKLDNELFIHYFKNDKCNHLHLCVELTLYYKYFFHDIPYNISLCFNELTKMEELIKFECNKQIILTFANSHSSHFIIEYATDLLLQDLDYSSIDGIAKRNFTELTLPRFATIYDSYLKEEVHKGKTSLIMPHLFLVNSQLKILLYSLKAIVIIMGNTLKVFCTLASFDDIKITEYNKHKKKGNQKIVKACYALLSSSGRILGINNEFEKYFYINSKLISKCKINLYQDILKLTPKKHNKSIFMKPLIMYNNLLEVHDSQMWENNQREYTEIFKTVKDIIAKLQKYPVCQHFVFNFDDIELTFKGKMKEYSLVYLSIEGEQKKSLSSFEKYIGTPQRNPIEIYNSYTKRRMNLYFRFEKEPADIIEKLTLIKLQALKMLFFKEGINGNIIKQFIEKKVDFDKDDCNSFLEQKETMFSLNNKIINKKLNIKPSLITQFAILIAFLLLFSIALVLITLFKHSLYTDEETIVYSGLYFQMSKRTLTVLLSLVLNLQLKGNRVYDEIIDVFPHTDEDLYSKLEFTITDYKEFIKKFKDLFDKVHKYDNPSVGFLGDLAGYEQEHIILDKHIKSMKVNYTLSDSLNAIHYKASKIIDQGLLTLMYFNNTGVDNVTEYKPFYFDDKPFDSRGSEELTAEDSSVFFLENILTNLRYPYIEALDRIAQLVLNHATKSKNLLFVLCMINSCLLFCLFIYQGVFYYYLNQKIFSKAFINFCYIQYFNLLLIKKTQMLKEFMEVATMESTVRVLLSRVIIKNKDEESNIIAAKTEQIDGDFTFEITPFEVMTEEIVLNNRNSQMKNSTTVLMIPSSPRNFNSNLGKNPNASTDRKVLRMKNQAVSILKAVLKKSLQKTFSSTDDDRNTMTNNSQTCNNLLNFTATQQQPQHLQDNQQNQTQTKSDDLGTNENIVPNPKLNQQTPQGTSVKHNSILQRGNITTTIVLFLIFCIYGFACSLIYYFISSSEFKLLQNFSVVQFQTLIRLDCFHEVLPGLQLSILKNRPLTVDYYSTGFLTNEKGTNRETLIDIFRDFYFFNEQYRIKAIQDPQFVFKGIIEFDSIIKSERFCEETAVLIDMPIEGDFQFSHLKDLTKDDFLIKCQTIGNGFNKNGFYTAMVNLINQEQDMYNEYVNKKDRDADYNFGKLNDKKLQIHFTETFYVLDFVMLRYQQVLSREYMSTHLTLKNYSDVYIIFAVLFIVIIALIYEERLLKTYLIEVDCLELTEILVYHTVIF